MRTTGTAGPGWGEMLRCSKVWGTSVGMFSLGYVNYFLLSWLPSYLVSERGLSMSSMAVLGSIPFLAMAASSVVCGWTSDRWIRAGSDPGKVRKLYAARWPSALRRGDIACASGYDIRSLDRTDHRGLRVPGNVYIECLGDHPDTGRTDGRRPVDRNPECDRQPRWSRLAALTGWIVSETGSFSLAFATVTGVLLVGTIVYLISLGK